MTDHARLSAGSAVALIARADKYLNTGSGEYASEIMRDMAEFIRKFHTGDASQPVAWRVLNDFGHWYITQDKAVADTYRDTEKKDVQPLYLAAQPPAAPCNAAGNRYASPEEAERAINGAYALADRLSGKPAAPVETVTETETYRETVRRIAESRERKLAEISAENAQLRAELAKKRPETLPGMIAEIYGELNQEDCTMVDREWARMRGYILPTDGTSTVSRSSAGKASVKPAGCDPCNYPDCVCRGSDSLKRLGARLADLLDADHWNNIEPLLLDIEEGLKRPNRGPFSVFGPNVQVTEFEDNSGCDTAWHKVQDEIDAWAQATLGDDAGTIMSWSDRLAQHLCGHAPDEPQRSADNGDDWRDDPGADERWNAGCDFAMERLCGYLGIDPKSVSWDAATETLDGDVSAVIGNILRAKFGEDWGPDDTLNEPQATSVPWKGNLSMDIRKGAIRVAADGVPLIDEAGVCWAIVFPDKGGFYDHGSAIVSALTRPVSR